MSKKQFSITANLWLYPGEKASWHFLTIPKKVSSAIKEITSKKKRRGWGSVQVKVKVGNTAWETSIFPDSRSGTYVLPVKASVRRSEGLFDGDPVQFTLTLQ